MMVSNKLRPTTIHQQLDELTNWWLEPVGNYVYLRGFLDSVETTGLIQYTSDFDDYYIVRTYGGKNYKLFKVKEKHEAREVRVGRLRFLV